ncbi:MAG: phosphodiesterase [Xanthomonadaceae bacterium]|nr:phosphodiesterase [Xanthomonadaceae bacterium]MDZ4377676.1 phosphodiesterase [Xanthomonadaceae bacterium]
MLNWRVAQALVKYGLAATASEVAFVGVLLLRVRRMHSYNIQFGHAAGEVLLQQVQDMIGAALRPSDRVDQVGDADFLIVLPHLPTPQHSELAAARLQQVFAEGFILEQQPVRVEVAIGIVVAPEHGTNADQLLRRVVQAGEASLASVQGVAVFRQDRDGDPVPHVALYEAIRNNRLQAYLQPIFEIASGRLVAVESLARWPGPDGEIASPTRFIAAAEQTGLITPLTRWSLNTSAQHAALVTQHYGRAIAMAVNLSPRALAERGMVEQILEALRLWEVDPQHLILEITETTAMQDPEASVPLLKRLRDHGLRIAIDDFGTGNASFTYLRHLPLTELKIDHSFVTGLRASQRSMHLVDAMIGLAHKLDLRVVAEGVDSAETLACLNGLGCDFGQGYFLGRPQPIAQLLTNCLPEGGKKRSLGTEMRQ